MRCESLHRRMMLPTSASIQDAVQHSDECCASSTATAAAAAGRYRRTTPASQTKSPAEVGQTAESGGVEV